MKIAIAPINILGQVADTAEVVGFSGLPPSYTLHLQKSTTTPAVGVEGEPGYVPAVTTHETLHTITKDAFVRPEQFDAWGTEPLEQVLPGWVAVNHGLKLV